MSDHSGLAITGIGMATCVGLDAENSAAAVRAGISRFAEIKEFLQYDQEELEAPITGAPLSLISGGYVQQGAWLRMIEFAFKDLLKNIGFDSLSDKESFWKDTPIIWVVNGTSLSLFQWPFPALESLLQKHLLKVLAKNLNLPLFSPQNAFLVDGAADSARAFRGVERTISGGHYSRAIIIAVDSLLDRLVLTNLMDGNRVKTTDNPVGLMPGEGASCVLVESSSSFSERNVVPRASVLRSVYMNYASDDNESSGLDEDVNWFTSNAPNIGRNLAKAIKECLSVLGDAVFSGDIYLDLNGEEWRAIVWGVVSMQLQGWPKVDLESCTQIIPASNWGDIGVASGLSSMCLVSRSYSRGYASNTQSLVCSVADNGNVGVVLMQKAING